MTRKIALQFRIKSLARWAALALLLSLSSLFVAAIPSPQEEEDGTRRLWNKRFEAARAKAKSAKPMVKPQPAATNQPAATQPVATADGELIGITVWRLRADEAGDGQRLLVRKDGSRHRLERVEADTPFSPGQRVRISIETTREGVSYVYVIDREVYADGRVGEPSLIFPALTTPRGSNVGTAGGIVSVPALDDPIPYFTLERSGKDHIKELLTIIISPEPLPLNAGQTKVDPAQLARWEKQWGGPTERRESRGGAGRQWTKAEQEAEKGERKLVQGDPLPQTIYRVMAKPGGYIVVNLSLLIAP